MVRTLGLFAGLIIFVIGSSAACNGDSTVSSSPLRAEQAPTEVEIAGRVLTLETELWRDFMPISPPDGKPLFAVLQIRTMDGSRLPRGIRADRVFITYGDESWSARVKKAWPSDQSSTLEVVARGGPKWGPGVNVDVVVRLRDILNRTYWLRAPEQPIGRTS